MQIYSININPYIKKYNKNNNKEEKTFSSNPMNVSFEARVDKGLTRFYEANLNRMPSTLKNYINKMTSKASQTPLQAQASAFAALAGITTVAEIKSEFEEEDLFKELKDPTESNATRGILGVFRENKELLEMYDKSILESKENLTVWLVKKIFLEAKTLDEINTDFNLEADKDFKALYENKENSNNPIKSGTLKALGIKLPDSEYLQSLRYTRDGYSDSVGEKISQKLIDFYASLPIEERTASNKKKFQNFENWWNSLTRDQQLDMIAEKLNELDLFEKYKASPIGKKTRPKKVNERKEQTLNKQSSIKIESKLGDDELFIIWATTNLKLFKASLTDYDKAKIQTKRDISLAERWKSMSAEEKTDYINKIRRSTEPSRYAMLDAWNNNQDIIIKLSHFLKKFHFNKPVEILYGTEEFNKSFSEAMSNFWHLNPDLADKFGEAVRFSHEKIKQSINDGKFELLKIEINKSQVKREKEIKDALKNYREVMPEEVYESYPKYMQEFIDANTNSKYINMNILPINYVQKYYELIEKNIPENLIKTWIKVLDKEPLNETDELNIKKIRDIETPEMAIISRVLEATMASILYENTKDPQVYLLSHTDCKIALTQLNEGKDRIQLYSNKYDKNFDIPILNKKFDIKEIDKHYADYMQDLDSGSIDAIIDNYIYTDFSKLKTLEEEIEATKYLRDYIDSYKTSALLFFDSRQDFTPEIKSNFAKKFISNINPKYADIIKLAVSTKKDFELENEINKYMNLTRKKYYFLPSKVLDLYTYELTKVLRDSNSKDYERIINNCCIPLKDLKNNTEIIYLNKRYFRQIHKLFTLVTEKTLSDILYKMTKNDEVYALKMEEMLPLFEALTLVKKTTQNKSFSVYSQNLKKQVEIPTNQRVQPYQIEKLFNEYFEDVIEYGKNCFSQKGGKISREEILYILNPDESKIKVDEFLQKKINEDLQGEFFEE